MPGRGGVWLVREIRRRWPQVGVIVLTAGCDQNAADECRLAGAHHYFFKPIKLDEFRHVLDTAARTYRLEQENQAYRTRLERAVRRQTARVRRTFLSRHRQPGADDGGARPVHGRPLPARPLLRAAAGRRRGVGRRRQRKLLSLAAKLHDIGKVGVPEAVLNKPDRLTDDEYRLVKRAPRHRRAHPDADHPQSRSAGRHPRPPRAPRRQRLPRRPFRRPRAAAGPAHRHPRLLRRADHVPRLPFGLAVARRRWKPFAPGPACSSTWGWWRRSSPRSCRSCRWRDRRPLAPRATYGGCCSEPVTSKGRSRSERPTVVALVTAPRRRIRCRRGNPFLLRSGTEAARMSDVLPPSNPPPPPPLSGRLFDAGWFVICAAVSSAWCLTAAAQLERHLRRTDLRSMRPGALAQRQHGRVDAAGHDAAADRRGDAAALPLGAPPRRPAGSRRQVLSAAAVGQSLRARLLVAASALCVEGGAVAGWAVGGAAGRRAAGLRTNFSRQCRSGYYGYCGRRLSAGAGLPLPRRARRPVAAARRLAVAVVRRRRAGQGVGPGLRRTLPNRGRSGAPPRHSRRRAGSVSDRRLADSGGPPCGDAPRAARSAAT